MPQRISHFSVLSVIAFLAAPAALAQPSDPVGATAGAGHPWIWVRFDNRDEEPVLNQDFLFSFTDPDAPGVVLNVGQAGNGSLHEWRVWATVDDDPDGDPASIGSITSPGAYNYSVRILNPSDGPGADSLGGADLTPSGDHHASIAFGGTSSSRIAGDLTGDLIVQWDSNEAGGELDLQIDGDVAASSIIYARRAEFLSIGGGDIPSATLAGTLFLRDGVQLGDTILMGYLDGTVDLNDVTNRGSLRVYYGGTGEIVNGGVWSSTPGNLPGTIELGVQSTADFSGTATFDTFTAVGTVGGIELSGTVHITGDANGLITFSSMSGNARIAIDGSLISGLPETPIIRVFDFASTAAIANGYSGNPGLYDWVDDALIRVGPTGDPRDYLGDAPQQPFWNGDFIWEITWCPGDMNNNGTVNSFDIDPFITALTDPAEYEEDFPGLEGSMVYHGDIDGNGTLNPFDIDPFIDLLADQCTCPFYCGSPVTEPGVKGASLAPNGEGSNAVNESEERTPEDTAAFLLSKLSVKNIGRFAEHMSDFAGKVGGDFGDFWNEVVAYLEVE